MSFLKMFSYILVPAIISMTFTCCVDCAAQDTTKSTDIAESLNGQVSDSTAIKEFQLELLALAFDTASKIPLEPHIKDRSKAQQQVIEAYLELDQPQLALKGLQDIENWRRGLCYASLALWYANHNQPEQAQECILLAEPFIETVEDWRRDRIRVRIAQAHQVLGNEKEANAYNTDVEFSEEGKLLQISAKQTTPEEFDQQIKQIEEILKAGQFDSVKNTLFALTGMYGHFFDRLFERTLIEDTIRNYWSSMPIFIRIDLLDDMAKAAISNNDHAKALELLNEAQTMLDSYEWKPEHSIPMVARMIPLRYQAGDRINAASEAEAALALFDLEGQKIVNIYRAGVLRPLAEAFNAIGLVDRSIGVYKLAIQQGMENPNSRPRAIDLTATCCSMALSKVEPDGLLWARIREINKGLGNPW